mmetsp:Transcript_21543/g.31871  ORF Transcript_21543/g.31871 Transcript_21543/m.31871 type:complete len:473 (-) Transcript_21543:9-1427(-)
MPSENKQTVVQLALYDLSRGMSRALSAQFLGGSEHAIDLIPHTGVIVYGKEYFFGGGGPGISAEHPGFFRRSRNIEPISVETIGYTTVSQLEFDDWCVRKMAEGKFSGHAYDLFQNNCNNFSHHAALDGLRLERGVPQHILDIPQKFLASPTGQMFRPILESMQVQGGGMPLVPVGSSPVTSPPTTKAAPSDYNPWARMADHAVENKKPLTPIIDKHKKPLLSNDSKTAVLCASKFQECEAIMEAAKHLGESKTITNQTLEKACNQLLHKLSQGHHQTFGLMLLRLFILHDGDEYCCRGCLQWISSTLLKGSNLSDTTLSMAWCCLSNSAATQGLYYLKEQNILEFAFQNISEENTTAQVKQAISSFLYNLGLAFASANENTEKTNCGGMEDEIVSLLCGSFDGLDQETDPTTQKRRLLLVGHILKASNTAVELAVDLGFDEILALTILSQEEQEEQMLTKEILALLQHARK